MIDELTLEERVVLDYLAALAGRWAEHLSACGLHFQAEEAYVAVTVARGLLVRDLAGTS